MIKVNLISHKRKSYKGRNWTKLVSYGLFAAMMTYFLADTFFVFISIMAVRGKINAVNKESAAISKTMLENNEKLSRFVLSKMILSKIEEIDSGKFRYKDYLDAVSAMLPDSSSISSVDFSKKGWMQVTVNTSDILAMKGLENKFLVNEVWQNNTFFSSAYVVGIARSNLGSFSTNLQFELKKTNGTK